MTNALTATEPNQLGLIKRQLQLPASRDDGQRISKALAYLGAKIDPKISDEQGKVWRASMVKALSDLPLIPLLQGLADAMHEPIRFFSEAETVIRACAGRRVRAVEWRLANEEQKIANAQPLPEPVSLEETQAILDEVWPRRAHVEKYHEPFDNPKATDAEDYAAWFGKWGIEPRKTDRKGNRHQRMEPPPLDREPTDPDSLRQPTREDYLDMGVAEADIPASIGSKT